METLRIREEVAQEFCKLRDYRGLKEILQELLKREATFVERIRKSVDPMRAILEAAVRPQGRLRLGTALSEMSRKIGPTNADVEALDHGRGAGPAEPMRFE